MNVKKLISFCTCLFFLFSVITQNVSAYHNVENTFINNKYINNFNFSDKFGKITEISDTENNIKVINIQDLHSNYSAQINIKNILDSIDSNYNIKKIFIEGGYGNIDVSWLNKIEDKNFREEIIKQLLLNGRLTGAEYFAYKNKKYNILAGIEDKQIHKQNLDRLSKIIDRQNVFDFELQKIKSDIDFLSLKYLSKENLYLNKIVEKYKSGKNNPVKFYTDLIKLINKIDANSKKYNGFINVNSGDFKNINDYLKVSSYKLNNDKILKELKECLVLIKNKISYPEYSYILKETNNFSDIKKLCFYINMFSEKFNINLAYEYPSLYKYVNNNDLVQNINPIDLIEEERVLLNNLRQVFSKSNTEYEISFLNDFFEVFSDYLKNKITFNNYSYFVEQLSKFKTIYSKYAVVDRLAFLEKDFILLDEYYKVNNLRNEIFLKNIFKNINIQNINTDKKEVVVIVSGGFHTKGLNDLLKENKINYVTITPNVNTNVTESDKFYKDIVKEQTEINNNALNFTIASSATDIEQFNYLVRAAIEIFGGIYSQNIIETIVERIKPLVKEPVNIKYSDKQTIIFIGNREIILNNVDGKIQNVEKNKDFKPVQIDTKAINKLFEKNPSLNFSDGLIFELRNADKYIDEINGIDLAVIARMPEIIQKYYYNLLPVSIKEKLQKTNKLKIKKAKEKLTIGQRIKKGIKRTIISFFVALLLAFGVASYVSPNDLTSLVSSNMYAITNIDLSNQENYLESLIKTKIEWTDTYMPSMDNLYYIYSWKYQLFQMENQISDYIDVILANDNLSYWLHQAYTDNEIEYLKILSNRNDRENLKRIINDTTIDKYYRFYAHMLLVEDGYKVKDGEFDDLFDENEIWQWIHDTDAEQIKLTDFEWQTKCYVAKNILGVDRDESYILRFARLVKTGEKNPDFVARSDLSYGDRDLESGIWSTAAHEIGHNDMSNKLLILEMLTSSPMRELYAYSYETLFSMKADINSGIYSRQSLISINDSTEEHDAGRAIITTVINNLGEEYADMLAEAIIDYYKTVPINKSVREETIGILDIFIDKVISYEIADNKIKEEQKKARKSELMCVLMRYNDYFNSYIDIDNNNEQIRKLSEYIYNSSQNIQNEEDFFNVLFDIKTQMMTNPDFIPVVNEQAYLSRWNAILNRLNETIILNINQIKNDKELNTLLKNTYTEEEIEYIKIYNLSFNKDTKDLESVIKSDKDMKYRFYANMIFMQKNRKEQNKYKDLFSKEELVEYLKDYSDKNPQMTDINNFDWQVLCGMTQVLYSDKWTMYNFDTVFSVKYDEKIDYMGIANPNPYLYQYSLSYIKDKTTNPVLVSVVANQLYNAKNVVIASNPHVANVREDLTQLYIDVCLLEASRDLSIDVSFDTKTNLSIKDIQDTTSKKDISKIVLNEVINKYGYESLGLLRESIYEYLKTGGVVNSAISDIGSIISSSGGSMSVEKLSEEVDKYLQENELSKEAKEGLNDFISRFIDNRKNASSRDFNTILSRYNRFIPGITVNVNEVMNIFYDKVGEKPVLSKDNKATKRIDKIKNVTIRNKVKNIYSIIIAPLLEASIINKIYYEKDEIKKVEKKNEFLNKHKGYVDAEKELKNKYEQGVDFILDMMDDVYNKIYAKTHIKPIAKLALTITNIKYHKQWNRENLISNLNVNKKSNILKRILITFLIFATLITGVVSGIYIQKNHTENLYYGYENSYNSHIKYFGNVFDVNSGNMSEEEWNKVVELENYVNSVIEENGEEKFYQSLLEIRKNITTQETKLMPSISNEDSKYMSVWRKLITYIDKTVAYNIFNIEQDEQLNIMLQEAYKIKETEYLKILSLDDENKLINIINDDNTGFDYRFYAYMVLKANGYNEKDNEFADLLNKDIIYDYLMDNYTLQENDRLKFINVDNSFDWQVLCGMMNFILDANDNYSYIIDNGRIVEAKADTDGVNAMAKSNLLYAHISSDIVSTANESPVLIAAHEMAHRRQNNTFGYLSNVMELYAYTVENIIGEDMGIEVDYMKKVPVYTITNETETHEVGNIIIESVKRVTGVDSLVYLEDSIVEYVLDGSNKNKTQVQMTDSILNIFVTKIVDNEISQGKINVSDRENRYNEIIVDIYGYNTFVDSLFASENEAVFSDFDKDLKKQIYSDFTNIKNKEDFFLRLLEIRKYLKGNMPTINDSSDMWIKSINEIDEVICLNMDYLEDSKILKSELEKVYDNYDLEYMKIYRFYFEEDSESLENIMNSNKDINYRFYAYMLLMHKNNREQEKYNDVFTRNEIIDFLKDYSKSNPALTEINDYDWQVLCGMTKFLYGEKWNIYNYDIVFSLKYDKDFQYEYSSAQNSYIYQNSLNYIKGRTENPVMIAIVANELYNIKNSLISPTPQISSIRTELTYLYIDTCLLEASKELSVPIDVNTYAGLTIKDINDNMSSEEISSIVLNEIINKYGYESLGTLRRAIYEYMSSGGPIYSSLKDILSDINAKGGTVTAEEFNEIVNNYIEEKNLSGITKEGVLDFTSMVSNNKTSIQSRDCNTSLSRYNNVLPDTKLNIEEVMNIFEKNISEKESTEDNKLTSVSNVDTEYIDTGHIDAEYNNFNNSDLLNKIKSQFFNFYIGMIGIIFSFLGIKQKDNRKVMAIYKEIFANQIPNYMNQKKENNLVYENIFIIKDEINNDIIDKLQFKSLGIKINGNRVFISDNNGAIFIYSDNSNFDDLVSALKNNVSLKNKIIKHINSDYNMDISFNTENIVFAKIVSGEEDSVKVQDDLITVSGKLGSYNLFELLSSYMDVMTRQGFIVKENLFRYMDDFDINLTKKERKEEFINILKQQIMAQLIFDFDTLNQIQSDFGNEIFEELLKQLQEQNIKIYVFISDKNQIKDVYKNKFISGYVLIDGLEEQENKNIKCKLFDCLTCDEFEITLVAPSNSDTCPKIISLLNANILKQPLVFRNSCIKKAVIKQRDTTIYAKFKSMFSLGRITTMVSDMKSEYNSKQFANTYTIKELAASFEEQDLRKLLEFYKNITSNKDLNSRNYSEVIKILKKCETLNKFFEVSDKSKMKNLDLFIENIIFRIMAASVLKQQDKDIGLKNKKYEELLAKALKFKFVNNFENNDINDEVLRISEIKDELLKEQTFKQYIEDNIMELTQKAFNKEHPNPIAINTVIYLMPYAETADIIIDMENMYIQQNDLRLTKNILSAA